MARRAEADRLLAVGLSHHTAPVEVRERLALSPDGVKRFIGRLRSESVCEEALVLSTCNRVEVYSVPVSQDRLRDSMREFRGPNGEAIDRYLYWYRGRDAVKHLFSVASSLDSLVLGEPQILGQVKDAVRLAEESASLGRLLHPLTRRTLSLAKRVRTETEIGKSRVGIGNAGVDLALQIFGSLADKRAMLVGAGEMGRQVARALLTAGLEELLVANRTHERGVELAGEFGGVAVPYARMADYLSRVDIVITATGSTSPIVSHDDVRSALKRRRYRPVFLVDLAVPRNVDPRVDDLDEAYLFNVDDLQRVIGEGKAQRESAARAARDLVDVEADKFMASMAEVDVNGDLRRITTLVEQLRRRELVRSKQLVADLSPAQVQALDAMTKAMCTRILHDPLQELRQAARQGDEAAVETLRKLWKE